MDYSTDISRLPDKGESSSLRTQLIEAQILDSQLEGDEYGLDVLLAADYPAAKSEFHVRCAQILSAFLSLHCTIAAFLSLLHIGDDLSYVSHLHVFPLLQFRTLYSTLHFVLVSPTEHLISSSNIFGSISKIYFVNTITLNDVTYVISR